MSLKEDIHVIKLDYDKKTYNAWSATLVSIFRGKDLLGVVEGTDVKNTIKDSTGKETPSPDWIKKDNEAASIIGRTLMPSELRYVNTRTDSAHEMWTKLKKRHVVSMYSAMKNAEQDLKNLKFKGKDMIKHIEAFNALKLDYEDLGGSKNELDYYQLFMDSLSDQEQWEPFRVITNLNEQVMDPTSGALVTNKITLEYVQKDAQDKYNKIGDRKGVKDHSANTTTTPSTVDLKIFAKRNTSFNTSIVFFNCGGIGHQRSQCTSGVKDNSLRIQNAKVQTPEKRNDKKYRRNHKPSASHTHNGKDEAWNTTSVSGNRLGRFLLDNCCTTTIVNDKSYFVNYRPFDVPMQLGTFRDAPGNGKHSDILGEGDIEIVSQYNGKDHVIKLTKCLFVPCARNI
jgi:hypothetical protein